MTFFVQVYLGQNLFLFFLAMLTYILKNQNRISQTFVLNILYVAIASLVILPFFISEKSNFHWIAFHQHFNPQHSSENIRQYSQEITQHLIQYSNIHNPLHQLSYFLIALPIFSLIFAARTFKNTLLLQKKINESCLIKKYKNIHIIAYEEFTVPFSFRTLRNIYVGVHYEHIINPENLQMILAHEFQHHRNGDTWICYFLLLLKLYFAFNPLMYLFDKNLNEIQELAVDETLVLKKKISPRKYSTCLWAIQNSHIALKIQNPFLTSSLFNAGSSQLKKRIFYMSQLKKRSKKTNITKGVLGFAIVFFYGLSSNAASYFSSTSEITMDTLQKWVQTMPQPEFPVMS